MTVRGCQRCGSRDIRGSGMADGVVPGYTELAGWTCNRCGHTGPEMLFDDDAARAEYETAVDWSPPTE